MIKLQKNVDCVLFSVPPILLLGPHLAPALLTAYAEDKGFRVVCYDPSPGIYSRLNSKEQEGWPYNNFEEVFKDKALLLEEVNLWLDEVFKYNPKIIGLSTHAWASKFFIEPISNEIRRRAPGVQIITGGPVALDLGIEWKQNGWVDHYVVGDGEEAFLELLSGGTNHPNIDGKIPVPISQEAFRALPEPDFSDSDVEYYKQKAKGNRLYLIGSRGCVFNCSFCNVPAMTQKYRYKDGVEFAREIMNAQERYNTNYIELADSITNAAPNEFRKMCHELIRLKEEKQLDPKIICFFRIRRAQITQEEDFALAAKAGICRLKIGVESGSFDVREHIGKKETNDDIFFSLEMCKKYGIKVNLLLIAGYINETEEMFQENLEFLREIKRRELDEAIEMVVVNELYISRRTPVFDFAKDTGVFDNIDPEDDLARDAWQTQLSNGEMLDPKIRRQRVHSLKKFVSENFVHLKNLLVFAADEKFSAETGS